MKNSKTQTQIKPAILDTKGGQFAFIRGHISGKSSKLRQNGVIDFDAKKNVKFQVATQAASQQIAYDQQAIDGMTALQVSALLDAKSCGGLPITAISAAMQELENRIAARQNGKPSGPMTTETIATDKKGRTLIRAVFDQRSEKWSLEICNAAQLATYSPEVTEDQQKQIKDFYRSEDDRLLMASHDRAMKNPNTKNVCALINKVIPRQRVEIRRFTLIGRSGEATCDSLSIGGSGFFDMLSIVAAFRPDLLDLFKR